MERAGGQSDNERVKAVAVRRPDPGAITAVIRLFGMKTILYVCLENSNRSQMAEAFTRMHAAGRAVSYSAGSTPSGRVNPRAVSAMRERGYDLTMHASKSLDQVPPGPYDWVITMGCGDVCPFISATHREDWALPDPRDMAGTDFAAVRDEIERRVRELLLRLDDEPLARDA